MQKEFADRLLPRTRALVEALERRIQIDIKVAVDPPTPNEPHHDRMRCVFDEYKAEIWTSMESYFPDASVFHELKHIQRFLADGVPQLVVCDDYETWNPQLETALLHLDNNLEHMVIVPIELKEFPRRHSYWIERIAAQVGRLERGEIPLQEAIWSLALLSASARVMELGEGTYQTIERLAGRIKALDLASRYFQAVGLTSDSKENLARVTFHILNLPTEGVCLQYLDPLRNASRCSLLVEVALPEWASA